MNRKTKGIILAGILLCLSLTFWNGLGVNALTTREQIEQKEVEKKKSQENLKETKENISGLENQKSSLQGKLNNLNEQLQQVGATLDDLEQKMDAKTREIELTTVELEKARETAQEQYEAMKTRIKYLYERNEADFISVFTQSGNFADMINYLDYVSALAAYDRQKLDDYREISRLTQEKKEQLEAQKEELETYKQEALSEQNKVNELVAETSGGISAYSNQISEAQAAAEAIEKEIKKQDEDLVYLRKKLAEEIAMSKRAANAAKRDISEVTFGEGDRALLAALIYCEAGAEPYAGQLAVGAVVINRVLSSIYPDTVTGVIYQNRQFSPVTSGRLALALANGKTSASCYQAADEAMAGVTNVGNCVYFRTPVEGLNGISIGNHIFY